MVGIDNRKVIHEGLLNFQKEVIEPELEKRCIMFCNTICGMAIQYRLSNPNAHNFTGNLLNSIIVCLYKRRTPVYACYSAGSVRKAIRVKMTMRKKPYYLKPDYDGEESSYIADVKTDQGWGEDDARDFFQSFKPSGNDLFNIVLAYPVEYAEWVEIVRGTTGIVGTYEYVKENGLKLLSIPYGDIPF